MRRKNNLTEWQTTGGQARQAKYKEANNAHAQYHKENGYSTCKEPTRFRCDTDAKAMVKKHLQWLIDKGAEESEIESAKTALERWRPMSKRSENKPTLRYVSHSQKKRKTKGTKWA